jgi:hypothetical protein
MEVSKSPVSFCDKTEELLTASRKMSLTAVWNGSMAFGGQEVSHPTVPRNNQG